jgi:hypothetical protein
VKLRFIAILAVVFIVQLGLMALVWNSPPVKAQRAYTPTPTRTPIPLEPSATPIPTLLPASQGAPTRQVVGQVSFDIGQCSISALDLIGAWVKAGADEKAAFDFTDSLSGKTCSGTYPEDVSPLFSEPNIWFAGAIGCITCHGADIKQAAANLSLASLAGIKAGSRRTDPTASGQDILGDAATWEKSKLYFMIFNRLMPVGRPGTSPQVGPIVKVGVVK